MKKRHELATIKATRSLPLIRERTRDKPQSTTTSGKVGVVVVSGHTPTTGGSLKSLVT